jgi:hypothetical protein
MKATLAKTVDGYKIILEKESENIALYLLNLGANRRDGHFFIWGSDAGRGGQFLKETLLEEGYTIQLAEQV